MSDAIDAPVVCMVCKELVTAPGAKYCSRCGTKLVPPEIEMLDKELASAKAEESRVALAVGENLYNMIINKMQKIHAWLTKPGHAAIVKQVEMVWKESYALGVGFSFNRGHITFSATQEAPDQVKIEIVDRDGSLIVSFKNGCLAIDLSTGRAINRNGMQVSNLIKLIKAYKLNEAIVMAFVHRNKAHFANVSVIKFLKGIDAAINMFTEKVHFVIAGDVSRARQNVEEMKKNIKDMQDAVAANGIDLE